MQTTAIWRCVVLGAVCLAAGLGLYSGCEDSPSDEGINNYFDNNPYQSDARPSTSSSPTSAVTINPAATSARAGELINFTATGGSSPFTWSVGTPGNGTIIEQNNDRYAVYTHQGTTNDFNNVVVTDGSGATSVASIN